MTEWEERYRQGDTPWDQGAAHPALVQYLARNAIQGQVLVPGCGTGHDVRALAGSGARVTGIDIAPSAIRTARSFPKSGDEEYQVADLFDLPAALRHRFDSVWEHTCFCAIDPAMRPKYVAAMRAALKQEGQLLALFYLNPGAGEGPPFGVTMEELDQLFGNDFKVVKQWVPEMTYPGREGRELFRVMKIQRE